MARQVRFDPFGMQLAGEKAGLRDEAFLQDQTRRARASDYQFNTLNPLRLRALQRQDRLGEAALPYDIDQLGINQRESLAKLFNLENPIYQNIGLRSGDFAPQVGNDLSFLYNNSNIGMSPQAQMAQSMYFGMQGVPGYTPDQDAAIAQNLTDEFGVPINQDPILNPYLYPGRLESYRDFAMTPYAAQQNDAVLQYLQLLQDQEAARLRAESSALWRELQARQSGLGGQAGATATTPSYDPVDIF